VAIFDSDGREIVAFGRCIGDTTNNVAEYHALIAGLEAAAEQGLQDLAVKLDSELLVRQMTGVYKVKSAHLKPLHDRAKALATRFASVRFEHVPRAMNRRADELCNQALDGARTGEGVVQADETSPRLF
jgi:ribonuclease HI